MKLLARIACLCTLIAGLGVLAPLPATAQDSTPIDSITWERTAGQAEAAIDNDTADDARLNALRQDIVAFRSAFDAARGRNAGRIATLREQIDALGSPPEGEGAPPEAPEVTANRTELNADLQRLLGPVAKAEAAFLRADSLISRIDSDLRTRQTRQLLSHSPSPLNPALWPTAVQDLRDSANALIADTKDAQGKTSAQDVRENLPLAGLAAVLGLVFIVRARRWPGSIVNWMRRVSTKSFGVWRFVVSLLRVILPLVGIGLLILAAVSTGVLGPRAQDLASVFAGVIAIMLSFRWVSEQVFARDDDVALLNLSEEARKSARFYVGWITLMIACSGMLYGLLDTGNAATASVSVISFPFFVGISFGLFQLGRLLRGYSDPVEENTAETTVRVSTLSRMIQWLGTGAIVVACAAPLLMALGYFDLASAIQRPYVLTLAVLGLVLALQRFLADVYGALTRQGEAARDALLPVLIGMVLVVLSVPLLALIWGAKLTDLSEVWTRFSQGFSIGDSRISPTDFIAFILIFIIGYMLTRLVQGAMRSNVLPKTKMDIGAQNAIVSGLGYVGIFLAALAAITGAGIDLSSLAIVAGALSVGIGFGLQNIVSNFVSGIILLIERPISEGDWIEVSGGQMGYVRDISVRSTRIETFDRTDVIVPNADLVSGTVTNYTRGNTVGRVIITVGVAYGTDTKRVDAILREIAEAQPMVLAQPPVNVLFVNFGADALEFEIRCFLRDVNWMMVVKNNINHAIAERFMAEGIEIPFAQRDLWLRNPEALQPAAKPKRAASKKDTT